MKHEVYLACHEAASKIDITKLSWFGKNKKGHPMPKEVIFEKLDELRLNSISHDMRKEILIEEFKLTPDQVQDILLEYQEILPTRKLLLNE